MEFAASRATVERAVVERDEMIAQLHKENLELRTRIAAHLTLARRAAPKSDQSEASQTSFDSSSTSTPSTRSASKRPLGRSTVRRRIASVALLAGWASALLPTSSAGGSRPPVASYSAAPALLRPSPLHAPLQTAHVRHAAASASSTS